MARQQPKSQIPHKCMTCVHSSLVQYANDPVIAICSERNGERFVANALTMCHDWQGASVPKQIRHLTLDGKPLP